MALLQEILPGRVISRRGDINWPLRSSDSHSSSYDWDIAQYAWKSGRKLPQKNQRLQHFWNNEMDNTILFSIWCLTRSLNRGLTSNKPLHYLLDCGDFTSQNKMINKLQGNLGFYCNFFRLKIRTAESMYVCMSANLFWLFIVLLLSKEVISCPLWNTGKHKKYKKTKVRRNNQSSKGHICYGYLVYSLGFTHTHISVYNSVVVNILYSGIGRLFHDFGI